VGRIRTVKPEFFTSEDIVALPAMSRLLYIATWCEADREGRLYWKPKTFKIRYFPADDCDINKMCADLIDAGLVKLYGDGLAYVPKFSAHQHVNPRETASSLPAPAEISRVRHASARVSDVQGGKERKGRKGTRVDDADGFDSFWTIYPNRSAKQDALKAWVKLDPDEPLQALILKAVSLQSQSEAWRKDGGKFVPHAATWINGGRWEDEPMKINGQQYSDIFAGAK
jgi:hypothetical protein